MEILKEMQNNIQKIPIGKVKVGKYQRPIKEAHVKKLIDNWDFRCFGVTLGNVRDGDPDSYWLLDGQQRIEALKKQGADPDYEIPMTVLHLQENETTPSDVGKEEARIYNLINNIKAKLTSLETFWSNVASGEKPQLDILRIVKEQGFEVALIGSKNKKEPMEDNTITATPSLHEMYAYKFVTKTFVPKGYLLIEVLRMIRRAKWGNKKRNTMAFTMLGLAHFMLCYSNASFYEEDLLRDTMESNSALMLHQVAIKKYNQKITTGRGIGSTGASVPFAKALFSAYMKEAKKQGIIIPNDDPIKWLEYSIQDAIALAKAYTGDSVLVEL